jgi:hypothetical protein
MSKIKKPADPSEVPQPSKDPEIKPAANPEGPMPEEPEFIPEKEPAEPSPAEIPTIERI